MDAEVLSSRDLARERVEGGEITAKEDGGNGVTLRAVSPPFRRPFAIMLARLEFGARVPRYYPETIKLVAA